MIFHENRLLADDSPEISCLIFSKIRKNITKFVVCCSCDWRFKGLILPIFTIRLRFSCNIIPYFCRKLEKLSQNLSSAAVVIGALRVKSWVNCFTTLQVMLVVYMRLQAGSGPDHRFHQLIQRKTVWCFSKWKWNIILVSSSDTFCMPDI